MGAREAEDSHTLFLELLREGPELVEKAGTWRKAMEGVMWVYPEQEDHPQNTARVLHMHKCKLKICKQVQQAPQTAWKSPEQVSCLLRSQGAFNCTWSPLAQGQGPHAPKHFSVTLTAELWVRRTFSLGSRCRIGMYLLEPWCSLT